MMNKAYIVKREQYLASLEETIDFTVGVYHTREDAEKAIEIHKKYVKDNNYLGSSWLHTYEIEETILNNFDPKFM